MMLDVLPFFFAGTVWFKNSPASLLSSHRPRLTPAHLINLFIRHHFLIDSPHARGERELIYYNMERGSESRKFMWFSSGMGAPGCSGADLPRRQLIKKCYTRAAASHDQNTAEPAFKAKLTPPSLTSSSLHIHMHKIIKNNSTSHNFMHGKIFNYIPPHAHWKKGNSPIRLFCTWSSF